jgi:hypothetical protein
MSEHYDAWFFLERCEPAQSLIRAVHAALMRRGASQDEDCFVFFEDHDGRERDPEPIAETERALADLCGWASLGGFSFWILGANACVFFHGQAERAIDCFVVSFMERAFESRQDAYLALVRELHAELGSYRTIVGWNLALHLGREWTAELERARTGQLARDHLVLDLRRT